MPPRNPLDEKQQPEQEHNQIISSPPMTNENSISWERWMESLVRITFAGSGGSLVGLALQKQSSSTAGIQTMPRPVTTTTIANSNNKHLPVTWAVSCMMFAWFMETTRIVSPTSSFLSYLSSSNQQRYEIRNEYKKMVVTAIGDSTVGGTVAGWAGVMGMNHRNHDRRAGKLVRPPILVAWGLGVGALLGALFGTLQAGIDAGHLYLREQQHLQQQQQQDEEKQLVLEKENDAQDAAQDIQ